MIPEDTPLGLDNCGIVSVAMLARRSYADTHKIFREVCGRVSRTSIWDRLEVMEYLCLPIRDEVHYKHKPTLRGWLTSTYDPTFSYHLTLTNHVVSVMNNKLFDQHFGAGIPALKSPYNRKRVTSYIKLR